MFYRIKENKIYDYADYEYAEDCLELKHMTKALVDEDPQRVIISGNELIINPDYSEIELAKAKAAKQAENISECNKMRYGQEFTVELQGKECLFDTTEQTERDLMKAFMATADGTSTYDNWVTNNYVEINLTHADVMTIYERFNMLVTPLYKVQKHYAELIEAAKTKAEVDAIEINYNINLEEEIDYSQYTVAQLKAMADERGISYTSNILKADLIALLEGNK